MTENPKCLDIELLVSGQLKEHQFGSFSFYNLSGLPNQIGIITLYDTKCKCGGKLTPQDYCNILEHEYVELFCVKAAYEDGIREWNADGFNDIARRSKQLHGN